MQEPAFADGAVELASVGVAADADVDCAEAGLLGIFNFSGQQDCAGAGAERLDSGAQTALIFSKPSSPSNFRNVPDSPPGIIEAVDLGRAARASLTSTTSTPSSSSRRRWASKSPCRARTPIFMAVVRRSLLAGRLWPGPVCASLPLLILIDATARGLGRRAREMRRPALDSGWTVYYH